MPTINHVFEPNRLLLVWTSVDNGAARHRRVVGEIFKNRDSFSFRYLKDTPDYTAALSEGFISFPAFTINSSEPAENALPAFMSRIPPRKRQDFPKYLSQYGLPNDFSGSDFSLLGYTGARLASDSFELCPDLSSATAPLDIILEVSGTSFHSASKHATEGMRVQFFSEPQNPYDKHAIAIVTERGRIGFVSRAINKGFAGLIDRYKVNASIIRSGIVNDKTKIFVIATFE
ncbi:hypothetical protein CCL11_15120 [Pseudomonas syringae]|uniref:HIRAN domain-containing protein n=1 Tax=Pseudomonas syringae TaxID=317 RepID=UPI000BB5CBF4|nr:HIRAN domain-containing protein [Pseudomonas syringae]PBP42880.1 hypothetical protein CCL11_15120 [Pseudomonas syringae]